MAYVGASRSSVHVRESSDDPGGSTYLVCREQGMVSKERVTEIIPIEWFVAE